MPTAPLRSSDLVNEGDLSVLMHATHALITQMPCSTQPNARIPGPVHAMCTRYQYTHDGRCCVRSSTLERESAFYARVQYAPRPPTSPDLLLLTTATTRLLVSPPLIALHSASTHATPGVGGGVLRGCGEAGGEGLVARCERALSRVNGASHLPRVLGWSSDIGLTSARLFRPRPPESDPNV